MGRKQYRVETLNPQPLPRTKNGEYMNENVAHPRRGEQQQDVMAGKACLIMAIEKGRYDTVPSLLRGKPDVNYQDNKGYTALILAVINNLIEIVQILLRAGALVDISDINRQTAIHHACIGGHESVLNILLRQSGGENVCLSRDSEGKTPLHLACQNGFDRCVTQLVNIENADTVRSFLDCRDQCSQTALHLASIGGHHRCVELLTQHGAKVSVQDDQGDTPLHQAARQFENDDVDGTKTIEVLIQADPRQLMIKNRSNQLPIDCSSDSIIIEYLRKHPLAQVPQQQLLTDKMEQLEIPQKKISPITISLSVTPKSVTNTGLAVLVGSSTNFGRERVSINNSTSATATPLVFSLSNGKLLSPSRLLVSIPNKLPGESFFVAYLCDADFRRINVSDGNKAGDSPVLGLRRFLQVGVNGTADFSDVEIVLSRPDDSRHRSTHSINSNASNVSNNSSISSNNNNNSGSFHETTTYSRIAATPLYLLVHCVVDYNLPTQQVYGYSHFAPVQLLTSSESSKLLCLQMTKIIWNRDFTASSTTVDITSLPWVTLSERIRSYFDECVPVERKLSDADMMLMRELCDPHGREYVEFDHFHLVVMAKFLYPLLEWLCTDVDLQLLWNQHVVLFGSRAAFQRRDVTHIRFATTTSRRLSVGDNVSCGWNEASTVAQALKIVHDQKRPVLLSHGKTIEADHEILSLSKPF